MLVKVTVLTALVDPRAVSGKATLVGDKVIVPGNADEAPDNGIAKVPPAPLLAIFNVDVLAPLVEGLNLTVSVQVAAGAKVPQLLVQEKSLVVAAIWPTVTLAVPALVSVTVCAAEVAPTLVAGNVRLEGLAVSAP